MNSWQLAFKFQKGKGIEYIADPAIFFCPQSGKIQFRILCKKFS